MYFVDKWHKPAAVLLTILSWVLGAIFLPVRTESAHAQSNAAERCFLETGHCISGRIREYWEQNGGLPVFGFPTGPQQEELVEGQPFQVQWFERHRLELHPENARPYDVLLGRLGAQLMQRAGISSPVEQPRADCQFSEITRFNVCGGFLQAWRADGLEFDGRAGSDFAENLALFGSPLSNEQRYQSPDGGTFTVQWFERARFEYHPENQPPYDVLFGLLGNELRASGQPVAAPIRDIAFVSARDGNDEIYVMRANGRDVRRLTNGARKDGAPAWSPDGSKIAFLSDRRFSNKNDIYVINPDGTGLAALTETFSSEDDIAWSPDGSKIAFVTTASGLKGDFQSVIFVMNADGSNKTALTAPSNFGQDLHPSWSPDGSRIAFASTREGITQLNVINVDGTNAATLANIRTLDRPAWSPDGTRIVFSGVQPSGYRAIFGVNADGSNLVNLSNQEGTSAEQPALSPDGQKIVYRLAVPNSQNVPSNGQIYIMNSDGSNQQMLLDTESSFLFREWENPRWAPDSNQIVFTGSCFSALPTQQPCARGIIVIRADGTGLTQITDGFTRDFQPDWRRN